MPVTQVSMWACMSSMSDVGFIVGAFSKYRRYRKSSSKKLSMHVPPSSREGVLAC